MNEEEIRLDQTKKVFNVLANLMYKKETCSYRYLIYDLLGFEGHYIDLMDGLMITNFLVEHEELQDRIDKATKYMEHYIEVEDAPINERIKIEFEYVIDILRGNNETN